MNFELEKAWQELIQSFQLDYDETPQVDAVLFVIGLQELNILKSKLTKDQKLDVIHIGLCAVSLHLVTMSPLEEIKMVGFILSLLKNSQNLLLKNKRK